MLLIIKTYIFELIENWTIKTVFSWIIIILSWLLWDICITIYALLALYFIDFILWLSIALKNNKVSSKRLRAGIFKFILYWIAIITWNLIDYSIFWQEIFLWAKYFITIYLSINEWLSILRHLIYLNIKLPAWLIRWLENYKKKMEDCDEFLNPKK